MSRTSLRTHRAGALTRADVGSTVRLGGWIHRRRDLGGIVFLDLRDREGLVQLSCDPMWTPADVLARCTFMQDFGPETAKLVNELWEEIRSD